MDPAQKDSEEGTALRGVCGPLLVLLVLYVIHLPSSVVC